MSHLQEIEQRHGRDRWKDIAFICAALVLMAVSIGSVTKKAAGKNKQWTVTVIDGRDTLAR